MKLPPQITSFGDKMAVAEAIKASVLIDDTISAGDANNAAIAVAQPGQAMPAMLGSFEMNQAALDRIQAGTGSTQGHENRLASGTGSYP